MTDKFEELVDKLVACTERRAHADLWLEVDYKFTDARAAVIAAYREGARPTHAYCIVEAPGYDRGEVKYIWLDKTETAAVIEQMNNPRSWASEDGPYELWTVELGLPTVEMMDDEELAEWKPELLKGVGMNCHAASACADTFPAAVAAAAEAALNAEKGVTDDTE